METDRLVFPAKDRDRAWKMGGLDVCPLGTPKSPACPSLPCVHPSGSFVLAPWPSGLQVDSASGRHKRRRARGSKGKMGAGPCPTPLSASPIVATGAGLHPQVPHLVPAPSSQMPSLH